MAEGSYPPPPLPLSPLRECPSLNLDDHKLSGTVPKEMAIIFYKLTVKRNEMAQKTKNKHFQANMEKWKNVIFCKEIFYSNLDTKAVYRHRKREINRKKKEKRNYIFISPFCCCNISCVTNFWYFFQSISLDISIFKNSTIINNSIITSIKVESSPSCAFFLFVTIFRVAISVAFCIINIIIKSSFQDFPTLSIIRSVSTLNSQDSRKFIIIISDIDHKNPWQSRTIPKDDPQS